MSADVVGALPSPEDDASAQRRLTYQLRNAGGPLNEQLARMLEGCAPRQRCFNGACILCGRRLQLATYDLIETHIREPARKPMRGRMSAVTIIPAEGIFLPGRLTMANCWGAMTAIVAALNQVGLSPLIAGLDISLNEDDEGEIPTHWSAHAHIVTDGWLSSQREDALRSAVTQSAWVRRRVNVDKLDGRANAPLYTIKPDRTRRVSYLDKSKVAFGRAPFRNTHRRDPRPHQAVALAQVEYAIGLRDRVLIRGIPLDAVRTALKGLYWPQDGP